MKHYYIADKTQPKGFLEITEAQWVIIMGTEEVRPYANKVYCGEMSIDDVPEEIREETQAVVKAKTARFGRYEDREISKDEALKIITGGAK